MSIRVECREPESTEMTVSPKHRAVALASKLMRDGKGFDVRPTDDPKTFAFVVYEHNHPNRWEAA